MTDQPVNVPPTIILSPFRIDLLAGETIVGSYVVRAASILDAVGRTSPRLFDRTAEASVDQVRILPLPDPE